MFASIKSFCKLGPAVFSNTNSFSFTKCNKCKSVSDPLSDVNVSSLIVQLFALTVVDLLYWRDVQRTGVVFGASLLLLLSLSACSVISVASYVALALLSVTISFRIYKGILQAVQKSEDGHPFK